MIEPGHTIPVLDKGFVRYIDHMGTDQRIVEAARISYKSPSKGDDADKKLIAYLYKNKHTSPFEMVKVTLNIKMPIFVMRQYVRHRMQNLNEVSARYTELPNEFYFPNKWRAQDVKNKQGSVTELNWDTEGTHTLLKNNLDSNELYDFTTKEDKNKISIGVSKNQYLSTVLSEQCESAYKIYLHLLEQGVAREMARMVLPVNIYTEIYACWDMKNLLHFITLREDAHAQAEIQEYGKAIKSICKELFPWTINAYERYKWEMSDRGESEDGSA